MEQKISRDLKPRKSLIIPLSLTLVIVILAGSFLYLKSTYPEVFVNPVKTVYNTFVPPSHRAATDQLTSTVDEPKNGSQSHLSSTPAPTRSPYPLIPDKGRAGTYKVSHNSFGGPTITSIQIDPLNIKIGEIVEVTLVLTHPTEIKNISASITTDISNQNIQFTKKERNENVEIWVGKIKLEKPVLYKYIYKFSASDGQKSSTLEMALRSN